ncbi:hypothetical protein, partial [Klebsiella pneumoniae]|uniref:hypothetical protein n=1 Tax=Klebsiella pneumoniae TaxID=573 RepID=UPI00377070C1
AYLCRSTFHHAAHHCLNIRVFSCQMSDYVSTYHEFLRALPYGNFLGCGGRCGFDFVPHQPEQNQSDKQN